MDPLTMAGISAAANFGMGFWSDSERSAQERQAMRKLLEGIDAAEAEYNNEDYGFGAQRELMKPYIERGQAADLKYQEMVDKFNPADYYMPEMGEFNYDTSVDRFLDPSMDYQLKRAKEATQGSAAAAGGLMSGKTLRDLQQEAQQFAQTDYGNAYQRMQGDRAFNYQDYLNRFKNQQDMVTQKYTLFKDQLGRYGGIGDRGFQASGINANNMGTQASTMADLATQRANVLARKQMINSGTQNFINNAGELFQGAGAIYQGLSGPSSSTSPTGPAMDMGMFSNYGPSFEGQGSSRAPYDYLNATGPDGMPLWMGL